MNARSPSSWQSAYCSDRTSRGTRVVLGLVAGVHHLLPRQECLVHLLAAPGADPLDGDVGHAEQVPESPGEGLEVEAGALRTKYVLGKLIWFGVSAW